MPEAQRSKFLARLSDAELRALQYDWLFWARDAQLAPEWAWRCWLILAGRGFGKTRSGAEWVNARAKAGKGPIALIGETAADVRDVMIELGESSILKVSPPWFMPKYEPSKRRVTWPNGVTATAFSGDEPDQLRGPQHQTAWADEPAKWRYGDEAWDNMEMGLRIGENPQVCATTTPRPIKLIKDLLKDPLTAVTRGRTADNRANLAASFLQRIVSKYAGTRLGRQELEAELLEDTPGALWRLGTKDERGTVEGNRVAKHPMLRRIVVAMDPNATDPSTVAEAPDEAGLIVAGLGVDGHGYVLDDRSSLFSPLQWAAAAVNAYHDHRADRVIGESNNGGDMIEALIRGVDRAVSYRKVWASRGKLTRAEPVAALYEQGKIHHVGSFPLLESEMTTWVPGDKSPNRMDALVWAFTELMVDESEHRARAW